LEPRDDLAGRARVGDVDEQVPQLGGVARRGGALEHALGGEERRLQRPVQGRVGRALVVEAAKLEALRGLPLRLGGPVDLAAEDTSELGTLDIDRQRRSYDS